MDYDTVMGTSINNYLKKVIQKIIGLIELYSF